MKQSNVTTTVIKHMDGTIEEILGELKYVSGLCGLDVLIMQKTEERAIRENWRKSKPHETKYSILKKKNKGMVEIFPMYAPGEEILNVEIMHDAKEVQGIRCTVLEYPNTSEYARQVLDIAERYMRLYNFNNVKVNLEEADK